jgi:hypothetical protein
MLTNLEQMKSLTCEILETPRALQAEGLYHKLIAILRQEVNDSGVNTTQNT